MGDEIKGILWKLKIGILWKLKITIRTLFICFLLFLTYWFAIAKLWLLSSSFFGLIVLLFLIWMKID